MTTIGIDFGSRRIGIAVSESGILATPHSVIDNRGDLEEVVERITSLAVRLEADTLVLGIPRRQRRDEETEKRYEAIAAMLREKTSTRVILWDEAYSTTEAASRRIERGARRKDRRSAIDAEAASVILQSFLDERGGRS